VSVGDTAAVADALAESNTLADDGGADGISPLMLAAYRDDAETIELLLAARADSPL
jgi:ankyrin repeat protein